MNKAKWSYENAEQIRRDVGDCLIEGLRYIMHERTENDEIKLAMLDGMMLLYTALKPFMEVPNDEDVQDS